MKILITGATGLIGSEIVRLCQEEDIAIHYLTTNKAKIVSETNYKGFYWYPSANEIDMNCFDGVTAIINLAGASISKRWTTAYKKKIISSRTNALRTLYKGLENADCNKITSFVSASAIGVYPHSISNFYTENEKMIDHSFLGEVVQNWEKEADTFDKFNFNLAKIRIGLVMSNKGGALVKIAKPIRYYAGAIFGNGEQWQSWICISDLARMFLFVIKHGLTGVYNGVGPNPVTNSKLIKEIAKILQKPLFLPNIPKFPMRVLLGKMSYLLFVSQRVCSKKIEEEGFIFRCPNIRSALEENLGQAIAKVVDSISGPKEYIS